jgi:GntR family transcriptional regulator, carbon starvation induced regulator
MTESLFNDHSTLASSMYDLLRDDIRHGRFPPGEKLRIDSLMELYEVGRTPVREALNRLAAEALIDQEDQRGFRTRPVSAEDLDK